MDLNRYISQLSNDADAIHSLLKAVSPEQARWKPSLEQWSILEVINHLADEEIEDFKAHLDQVLQHSEQPWTRIDPQGWVFSRRYNQQELKDTIDKFLNARMGSLVWLRKLVNPDWDTPFPTPWGSINGGDLLASWATHDLLHLRQLVELHYAYINRGAPPYHTDYAGPWQTPG